MQINVKYDVGDMVDYWKILKEPHFADCGCCGNTGVIEGQDGYDYTCPECEGQGKILAEYVDKKVWSHGIISSVHVRYDSNTYPKGVNIFYRLEGQPDKVLQSNIIEEEKEEEV